MHSSILRSLSSLRTVALCAAVIFATGATAAELAQRDSQGGGVSISVKPADVSASASTWRFEVALNTHMGSLDDDLAKTAVLIHGAGKPHAAAGWQGDPGGGHHRRGVLLFKPLSPQPKAIELDIRRAGEAAPRQFRWELK